MTNNTKANDWIVALVDNPTFGLENFKDVGLSADNTVLQDKNTYRNSQYIQDKFQDNNGKFDETAFNKFYNNAASLYQTFANNQFEDDILSDIDFDPYDALRPKGAEDKTRKLGFDVVRVSNPDRLKTGISRVGRTEEREWTVSELAQKERVFDYDTQQWKDYTPNDRTLFGNLGGFISSLSEPLVIAQWDDDGYHIDQHTGRRIKHKKGDYKYNEEGNYYYETLGGREAYGKQFKSIFDSFTVDGSKGNKYDFFDSDSLDKSVTGTVMKTVTTLAPLFIPGVNGYYGAALVGANLLDILPSIYKSTVGLAIDEETPTLNLMQGIGRSLKGSKSEYSQNHLISTENFFDLVTDVALQWAQQRAIFSAFNKLAGTNKLYKTAMQDANKMTTANLEAKNAKITADLETKLGRSLNETEKAMVKAGAYSNAEQVGEMATLLQNNKLKPLLEARNRMATDAALGYMATMSGIESFESAIEQGADKTEAAAVAWGSIAGMFLWDRTGIGEIFFPELKGEQAAYQKAIDSVAKEITKGFNQIAETAAQEGRKKGLARIFNWAKNKSSNFWKQVNDHSLTFTGKAFGEGIEEVGEELITDFFKSTFNWAQEFGWTKSDAHLDAWENMAERYGMSFFGGALGGAIFAGVDLVQNRKNSEQLNQELIYLIRNGRSNELIEELDKMKDKGKLGNRNLSATKFEVDSKDPSKPNWLSPTNTLDNQNEATYGMVKNYIQSLDAIIHQEGLAYSDQELLDKMVMGDQRMKSLLSFGKVGEDTFGPLMVDGYNGRLLQDWNTLSSDLLKIEQQLQALEKGIVDGKREYTNDAALQKAKSDNNSLYNMAKNRLLNGDGKIKGKLQLIKERDKFLNGQYSQHYVDQMLFAIDNNVNQYFFEPTFKDYAENQTQQRYENIAPAQLQALQSQYEAFKNGSKMANLDVAYEIYKDLNKKGSVQVGQHGKIYENYLKVRDLVRDQLIDLELTKEKLESVESRDIETIEDIFKKGSVRKTISPELKEPFRMVSTAVDPNLSPNDQILQRGVNDAINAEVLRNIQGIVDQFKQIGFIDQQTKDLLLKAVKTPIPQEIVKQTLQRIENEGNPFQVATYDNLYSSLQPILDSITPQNIEEVKNQIREVFKTKEAEDWSVAASQEEEDILGTYTPPDEKLAQKRDEYLAFIDQVQAAFNSDPTLQVVQQLESDILSISDNPVYGLVKQFSVNTFGKPVTVFDVLEQENTRLGNVQSLSEYVLDPTAEQQIDQGLTVLNMTDAIINASSTHEFNSDEPYGHNQTLNYFLDQYFPQENRLGIVRQDLAAKMKEDIADIRRQLLFLKELSRINAVNQFSKHKLTGKVVTKIMSDILRGQGRYGFLHDIEYKGHRLFDGIDALPTSALDGEQATDEIYVQADKLQDLVYDNFQKIVEETGDSPTKVFRGLFQNLKQMFSEDSLINQRNSQFDPQTKNLEDFDVFLWLTSLMSMKKSDFNYYLREVLQGDDIKFAPLFAQEYTAQMALSFLVNPELLNTAIDLIQAEKGNAGEELIPLKNLIMMNGIGGAGKTSVVAKIIDMVSSKLFPNSTIWKAGPTKEQSKNLTLALGSRGSEFDIDGLMKKILGDEAFGELQNDIKNRAENSKYYTLDKYPGVSGNTVKIARATKIEYSATDVPKIVFLDEATHINSIYLQHLVNWATDNNVLIVAMGDLIQNGYNDYEGGFYNIDPQSVLAVRTPKLKISMRINNIQKDNNTKTELAVIDFIQRDLDNFVKQLDSMSPDQINTEISRKAAEYNQFVKENLKFHRFNDDSTLLNGEQLVQTLDQNLLQKMLEKGKIGVVYDNTTSPTYTMLQQYIQDHPEAAGKIDFFTPKEVQGSERPYFIIDLDFNKANLESGAVAALDFMKNIYTMQTRSKVGTVFIDNGLSQIISKENWITDDYTNETPNPEQIIKDFRDNKLEILDATLGDYMPSILPQEYEDSNEDSDEDSDENDSDESPNNPPSPNNPTPTNPNNPSSPTPNNPNNSNNGHTGEASDNSAGDSPVDSTEGDSSNPEENPAVTTSTDDITTSTGSHIPTKKGDDGVEKEFLDRITAGKRKEDPITLNEDAPQTLTGIRAYGWYMRYGVNIAKRKHGTTEYNVITFKENPEKGVVDDLNVFLDPELEYTDADISKWSIRDGQINSIHNAAEMLKTVRNYLTFGQKFDEDFIDLLKKRQLGSFATMGKDEKYALQVWNSGTFKLQVRKNDETYDRAIDKNGYDASKVDPVAFNLIYEINLGDFHYQFTIGKLPKPETWKAYIDSTDPKTQQSFKDQLKVQKTTEAQVRKSYQAYEKWYRNMVQYIMANEDQIKYFDVSKDSIRFQGATRMVAIPEEEGKKHFDLSQFYQDNPNAVRSPIYIYAGKIGETARIKDSVKGKAIVFVAANRDVKIDGERITSENIADLYIRQQQIGGTPVIRMMIVEPKGQYIFSPAKGQVGEEGYFTMNYDSIVDENNQSKFDKDAFKEKLAVSGSSNTAASMIVALWNYRAGLVRINELIDRNPDKTEQEINNLIESDSKLREMEFRLEVPSNGYGMDTIEKIQTEQEKKDKKKPTYLVTVIKAQAKAQKQFLDSLIDIIREFSTLPNETTAKYGIGTSQDTFKKGRFNYTEIIEDLDNNTHSMVLETPNNGKLKVDGFEKGGAFKVVTLLSAISRIFENSKNSFKPSNYILNTTDKNGNKITKDLTELAIVVGQALTDNGLRAKTAPKTFIRNTFNMIFHGKLNPYANAKKHPRSYAPFPYGIYYHPRYDSQDKSRPVADFYPCRNVDKYFTYDVAVENSNLEIDIDLTKLKESAPRPVTTQVNNDAMRLQVENFAKQVQNLNLPFFDEVQADIQQSGVLDSQSQADLNAKLDDIYNKIVIKLNDAVAKGKFLKNGDPVIKAELTRGENGSINISYSTLTDMLRQKGIGAIPVAADGSTDYTQITSIDYTTGNDGKFVVTLQNGNVIKGSINGNQVKVEDQDVQSPAQPQIDSTGEELINLSSVENPEMLQSALEVLRNLGDQGITQEQSDAILEVGGLLEHVLHISPNRIIKTEDDLFQAITDAEGALEELIGDLDIVDQNINDLYDYLVDLETQEEVTRNKICKVPF